MANKKPILVHKTVTYLRADMVSREVIELVETLKKSGYKQIKVIVHDPEPGSSTYSTVYSTTVIATLDNSIDIGFNPPK